MRILTLRPVVLLAVMVFFALGCGESWEGRDLPLDHECATLDGHQYAKSACQRGYFCNDEDGHPVVKKGVSYKLGVCAPQSEAGAPCLVDDACKAPLKCGPDPKVATMAPTDDQKILAVRALMKTCQ